MNLFGINTGPKLFGVLFAASLGISGCGGGGSTGPSNGGGNPDGLPQSLDTLILYNANGDIHTSRHDGSEERNITNTPGRHETPGDLSPDGKQISYTLTEAGKTQVWLRDIDGKNPRPLISGSTAEFPYSGYSYYGLWSPDGSLIAFTTSEKPYAPVSIVVCKPDGTEPRIVLTSENLTQITWHPNGKSIAFSESPISGNPQISSIDLDGTNRQVLIRGASTPDYSPRGDKILCRLSGSGYYVMSLDGSGKIVSLGEPFITHATWTDDGSEVITRRNDGLFGQSSFIQKSDGSDSPRPLTFPNGLERRFVVYAWR